jgi:hypothetical protein
VLAPQCFRDTRMAEHLVWLANDGYAGRRIVVHAAHVQHPATRSSQRRARRRTDQHACGEQRTAADPRRRRLPDLHELRRPIILGWHRAIEGSPHNLEIEIGIVAVSSAMLVAGVVRERRARRAAATAGGS